MQSTLSIQRY